MTNAYLLRRHDPFTGKDAGFASIFEYTCSSLQPNGIFVLFDMNESPWSDTVSRKSEILNTEKVQGFSLREFLSHSTFTAISILGKYSLL